MKKFCLALLIYPSVLLFSQEADFDVRSTLPKKEIQLPISKHYPYWKLGTTIGMQNFALGYRFVTEGRSGHDVSINSNLITHLFANSMRPLPLPTALPSLKYTFLLYTNPIQKSNYFGVGLEAITIPPYKKRIHVYPNIQLVWGKERESLRFSQLGVNILPLIFFVQAHSSPARGFDPSAVGLQSITSLVETASRYTLVSYEIGF